MKHKKWLLLLIPLLLLVDLFLLSTATELLRQQSDTSVLLGVLLGGALIIGNYFLINYIIKQLTNFR